MNTNLIANIKKIFQKVDSYDSLEFRLTVEKELKKAGDNGIQLMIKFLNSPKLESELKIELIKIAGYIRDFKFLIPLKKIIDTSGHIILKK